MSKVIFLDENDKYLTIEEYQNAMGLKGQSVSKYFSSNEPILKRDIADYGVVVICVPLFKVLDKYRELKGKPVNINSLNRSDERQRDLRNQGIKAATTSPHVEKIAVDVDTVDIADTLSSVALIKKAAKELGIPVRLGYKQYLDEGKTFIHIDVAPYYYGKGRSRHNDPHPLSWETETTW